MVVIQQIGMHYTKNDKTKKKLEILFLLAFAIFSLQYASASSTLNNYVLESVGLNTTINLTFQITFDELIITDHSIEIYNLSYTHPSSCNSQSSSQSLFNYTTANQSLTGTQAFSRIQCGGGGSYHPPTCNPLWICEQWSSCLNNLRTRQCVDINYCNSNENPPLLLSCSLPLPSDRIKGCVNFVGLDGIIVRWKLNIFRFDILNEGIYKWKHNIDC